MLEQAEQSVLLLDDSKLAARGRQAIAPLRASRSCSPTAWMRPTRRGCKDSARRSAPVGARRPDETRRKKVAAFSRLARGWR